VDTEVSQQIYERFLDAIAELPAEGAELAAGLRSLLLERRLHRERDLTELYQRLAEHAD